MKRERGKGGERIGRRGVTKEGEVRKTRGEGDIAVTLSAKSGRRVTVERYGVRSTVVVKVGVGRKTYSVSPSAG